MFSGKYFMNATSAEIYMPQTVFILLSFYLFHSDRAILSSLSFLVATLISPLSIFSILFFPALGISASHNKKKIMQGLAGKRNEK